MSRGVAVLVLGLAAAPAVAEEPPPGLPPLRLVWFDPGGAAWGTYPTASSEATRLLGRLGATVSWRHAAAGEELRPGEIWIVLVDRGKDPASDDVLVLGATGRAFAVARVIWVHVPSVRLAVGIQPGPMLAMARPGERIAAGVAIGRVIVHEVVHALVPSMPHGTGLMSQRLTRRELTGEAPPLDPEAALAFRAALRGDPVLPPPGRGIVAFGPEAIR